MKHYFLIARKQVVLDIISGKQKTEERDYSEYYVKKFKDLKLPCLLKIRGGYNRIAPYVIVRVKNVEIVRYSDEDTGEYVGDTINFILGSIIEYHC